MVNNTNITQAILHITYVCTHRCPMCYANANNEHQHPSITQLVNVVDKLDEFGIKDITLVGGDPALYPNIVELVKYMKNKEFQITVLSNTLDFCNAKEHVLNYIDAYEGTIHHSIVENHDKFSGCKGSYKKLVGNLQYFSSHHKSIGLAINLIPFNYDVIYDIVFNIVKHNIAVDHIVLQRIIQLGRAVGSYNYELSQPMIESIMLQIEKIESDFGTKIIFEDPLPLCSVKEVHHRYMHPCEWGITKISVDYNGNLSRCGADIFHSFGSIFDENIIEKWNNDINLNRFRSKCYLPSKCKACQYINICGGGCPISRNPAKGFTLDYLANKEV